jgi:segregation and condensation protein B
VSKRKKTTGAPPSSEVLENESVTIRSVVPPEIMQQALGSAPAPESSTSEVPGVVAAPPSAPDSLPRIVEVDTFDSEMTVNLAGDPLPGRDDLDEPTVAGAEDATAQVDSVVLQRKHLRGLLEALVFASDSPITPKELAKLASAQQKQVKELLGELQVDFATRGIHLDEVAGGWVFRTSPQYAPFVRDLTKQKPVRLTRAQVETLAIIAYRQPITRPEVDDVRGVDSGPVLKLLLERDLVRILGKRDEPGRPLIYGTTGNFLEFFGLKSLKDLPTLREFTELSDESREAFEDELAETPEEAAHRAEQAEGHAAESSGLGEHEGAEPAGDQPGESEGASDDDAIGRAVRESMRVPIGESSSGLQLEYGDDDDDDDEVTSDVSLAEEPIEGADDDADGSDDAEEAPREPDEGDDDAEALTSDAPNDEDDR